VKQLFAEVAHEFGGLDVLVNNAGVYSFGPLESVTEAEFHRQYNTNVLGTLLATQEAVKLFGEKDGSTSTLEPLARGILVQRWFCIYQRRARST
jgi:3-oxoacyl-[acyl-carrier protein] reductase